MVLNGENWPVPQGKPAVRPVEQRNVSFLHVGRNALTINREPVVHCGDFYLAGDQILYRMIGSMVALVHFARARADRNPEHLMAEADAKSWNSAIDDLPNDRNGIFAGCRRVAR